MECAGISAVDLQEGPCQSQVPHGLVLMHCCLFKTPVLLRMPVRSSHVARMKCASIRRGRWLVWEGVAASLINSELAVSLEFSTYPPLIKLCLQISS